MSEVKIVEVKPQMVLGTRKKGFYKDMGLHIPRMFRFMAENNIECKGAPIFVCHECTLKQVCDTNEAGTCDMELCVPIDKEIPGKANYMSYELPGGKMAMIVHKGPYEECGPAYQTLLKWIKENDYQVAGLMREVYVNDPREIPPEEIETEIYAPVEALADMKKCE